MDFNNYSPALVLLIVVSLALAPFVAVMVTSFTKIVVVLSLLRNALGLQQVPPNVVINGLAIVLSIYVMYPVILDVNEAVQARLEGRPPPASVQVYELTDWGRELKPLYALLGGLIWQTLAANARARHALERQESRG